MHGITLSQPYASLAAWEEKQWETRPFRIRSHPRGLCIQAGKITPKHLLGAYENATIQEALQRLKLTREILPHSAIVAVVDVEEILSTKEWVRRFIRRPITQRVEREYAFGDYGPKRFAWKLKNVRRLAEPVPCSGSQGIWRVPAHIEDQVNDQLEKIRAL